MTDTPPGKRSGVALFFFHAACFLLVVVYVNMFQLWAWLSRQLGPGLPLKILPIVATLAVLFIVFCRFAGRVNRGHRISFIFLGLGIVSAFLALAIPDSEIPVKRVHVAEYIILSFLVRYVLSHRLTGLHLTMFTALVTSLYGVHDEMLQGLHSLRYFGWLDIIVNAVGGLSGALLGHALFFFDEPGRENASGPRASTPVDRIVLFSALLLAVLWEVVYLYQHRSATVFYPAIIPVLFCSGILVVRCPGTVFSADENHGLQAVFWLALGLAVYPLVAGLEWVEFL